MKWNDIRRIGPLLVVALAAVVMINPSFVGSSNSVGSDGSCLRLVSADIADDYRDPCSPIKEIPYGYCGDDSPPIAWDAAGSISAASISGCEKPTCASMGYGMTADGKCCIEPGLAIGITMVCESPEPEPETDGEGAEGEEEAEEAPAAPAVKLPPPPDPIIGPIWLGAIQVDASIPGLVTLTFPDLLAAFMEDNVVTIYDADDAMVFEGRLGADATILVFSDNAPMLVKTQLTTGALYFETVGASTTP